MNRYSGIYKKCNLHVRGGAAISHFAPLLSIVCIIIAHYSHSIIREQGRDLTQSYDKSPYTPEKIAKSKEKTHKCKIKTSITQRFWTDLGRPVGVATATQLVWINQIRGPNLPTNRKRCVIKRTHIKNCKQSSFWRPKTNNKNYHTNI